MQSTAKFGFVPDGDFESMPCKGFSASDYEVRACSQARAIRHGEVIDLGDRAFEVMHLPGHSSGSIGLYNPLNRRLSPAPWFTTANCWTNRRNR